jgi:Helix-hairpin-helix motif
MAKKGKKGRRGRTIATIVELAGAAGGLVSLAHELMQRHQAGKQQADGKDHESRVCEGNASSRADYHERPGSLFGKIGTALGAAGDLININRATPEVLQELQPIGRKRAKRIVARRPFKDVKQLKRVLPKDVYRTIKRQLTV